MKAKIDGTTIELVKGDITQEDTETIVNAANSRLAGGGGVDGAIHRAGGPKIMEECSQIGGCPTGGAVVTSGGDLKAKYVIHAVAPVYRGGSRGEAGLLAGAYTESLARASEKDVKSVSFPSLGTGAYGYPIEEASRVALRAIMDFVRERKAPSLVRFVLFSDQDYRAYEKALDELT